MGTRADFYIGRGKNAEWIGSIAWEGYPRAAPAPLLIATSEHQFRDLVATLLKRDDATLPKDGWPWPWPWIDSTGTDYAYAFDGGKVWCSNFGSGWFNPQEAEPVHVADTAVFPDMRDRQAVTFGKRSGVIVFKARRDPPR